MKKKAFTLIEVILSLFILSATLACISKIFIHNSSYETYGRLLVLENDFSKNGTVENTGNIVFK